MTLVVLDPNRALENITDDMYRSLNDYVLIYSAKSQVLTYIKSITDESIFIIICETSLDKPFLSELNNLNQVHSIFMYSTQQQSNDQLKSQYSKLVGIFTEQEVVFQQVKACIEYPFAPRFGFYHPEKALTPYTKLSNENASFFWNLLLKDLLKTYELQDKSVIIQNCQEYYHMNTIETENIKQFESGYDSHHAYEWYLKSCFVSKLLDKAFQKADVELLKSFNFLIRDLYSPMQADSNIKFFYCTKTIEKLQLEKLLNKVGQLMTFSGFLLVHRSPSDIVSYPNDSQAVVVFEIGNLSTCAVHRIDSENVIIDLGTVFQVKSVVFDDLLSIWRISLVFSDEALKIAQEFITAQQQTMERMTLPIIMGDLLIRFTYFSTAKNYFDHLNNEDDALIYRHCGIIYHMRGEYQLALDSLQIAYELMISDDRVPDSTAVLHDIGYVYDMTKEFNDALDNHRKALEIREIYYPNNDIRIGISLYNIGRTLVNMRDDREALTYHQRALAIFEDPLSYNHFYTVHSLHSHGVVYFNIGDYEQARYYYRRALALYEVIEPREENAILMVKSTLEKIETLLL